MTPADKSFTMEFYLSAGEAGPEQVLPVSLLMSRLIEVATAHANRVGAGYEVLAKSGIAWVLSRVTIEMDSYPAIDTSYSVTTWVEDVNRRFSTRCYCIRHADGTVAGYARTVWVVINMADRTMGDISVASTIADIVTDLPCPIARAGRHKPVENPTRVREYTFLYSDIDSNRHVNTVRYVQLLMNRWPLGFYDEHRVRRLEMSFMHESYFGEIAEVRIADRDDSASVDICVDSSPRVHFEITFE